MSLSDKASQGISILKLIEIEGDDIERIIELVQNNQLFFDVRPGESCICKAADKLQLLIEGEGG